MIVAFGFFLALLAVAGGALGWRKGTRDLAQPRGRGDRPIGVGRREFERQLKRRYRLRRILLTAGFALGAAGAGFALLMVAAIRRWFG